MWHHPLPRQPTPGLEKWQHPGAFKILLSLWQKVTKSTWRSSKDKKLLEKSQLASTQHSPLQQLSYHPDSLQLLHRKFIFRAMKLSWMCPGSAPLSQATAGTGTLPWPWSFLPAHQKMPAKSFGSSGSAANSAHPGTDFS